THVRFAGADVERVRRRGRQRDRADRGDALSVEDRLPGTAGVFGLPHAAVYGAEIEMPIVAGNAADREHAPAAKRTDETPGQAVEGAARNLRGGEAGGEQQDQDEQKAERHE